MITAILQLLFIILVRGLHQLPSRSLRSNILDDYALYPDSSLADLYDLLTMPPELRKVHTHNDIAVMQAYGFSTKMSEADCVAALMKIYQELISKG